MWRTASLLPIAACLVVALAACKPSLDPSAQPIADAFFEEVRDGGDLMGDTHLAHELKNPTTVDQLAQFRDLIPADAPRSIRLDSWDAHDDSTGETTRLKETYTFADRTLVVQTALFKAPAGREPVIVGFKVEAVS
ncbi:MAG TPA: hypothetical protein VME40_07680 [Caulobacteraceae bacterium]|nr:hypothetical protein [Caulobacteraceae bacterium]